MQFLKDCYVLKIEDILPFFSDVVTIDQFKVNKIALQYMYMYSTCSFKQDTCIWRKNRILMIALWCPAFIKLWLTFSCLKHNSLLWYCFDYLLFLLFKGSCRTLGIYF